jgi:ribosome-associated heat shock protein Hsp15
MAGELEDKLRVDKWLWAARFYKTRSIAADAVETGKVLVNGAQAKPARALKVDDALQIRTAVADFTVHVTGLSSRRGPAAEAAKLYRETAQSRQAREDAKLLRKDVHPDARSKGRPTKRTRRELHKFRGEPL